MRHFVALGAFLFAFSAAAQSPVRPGSESLGAGTIESSRGTYKVRLIQPMQQDVGTYMSTISVDSIAGTVTSTSSLIVPMANQMQSDSLVASWPSLAPISHQSENSQRLLALTFDGASVAGMSMPSGGSGDMEMIDVSSEESFFDEGWITAVIRSLPLAEGYTTEVAVFDAEKSELKVLDISVTGKQDGAGPDGATTAWIVASQAGPDTTTYLIGESSRELLLMRFSPQPGVMVELVKQ